MDMIEFDDFKKLEMRVGTVVEVERIPKTDKLYKMMVDVGEAEPIQIVSSLVPYYKADELMDQRIIVLVNLRPTRLGGEISYGMLLAAETKDEKECVLLTTMNPIVNGTPIT